MTEQEKKALEVRLSSLIAPVYHPAYDRFKRGTKTHFWLKGGRGSGKSTFAALCVWLDLLRHPEHHAMALRKVGESLRSSVFAQLLWAADMLHISDFVAVSLSPPALTLTHTDQKIYFRGVDDARKLKSIRPPLGHFGVIWFEEADEFSDRAELDSLLQSLLRGGCDGRVLYSFNPPKNPAHWIYGALAERRPDTEISESCWTDLPENWLGKNFVQEALQQKKLRPEKYAQEYLGRPSLEEGAVFRNLTLRPIEPFEQHAGRRLHGLDFGYGADPLHYVSCALDQKRKRLFVLDEFRGYRVSLERAAAEIQARNPEGEKVTCDSAEPRSIATLRALGIRATAAMKGPGSLETGMRFLCDGLEEIVIDPAVTPETAAELQQYTLARNRQGKLTGGWPDKDNHAIDALRYALEEAACSGMRCFR